MHMYLVLVGGLLAAAWIAYLFKKYNIEAISAKEYAAAAVFFMALLFWFMGITGVLQSGYHFVDDHEVYTIGRDLSEYGFWTTMYKWISGDLHQRFRFTYFLIRVTECYFFGDNFMLWHVFQTFTAAAGLFLSYVFARKMKCTVLEAYIFAVMIYVGAGQSAVWWRLGPQENLGTILFMLTLLSLRSYLNKNKVVNLILSIVLTILLGGIKESFLLLLPLLPIWITYWDIRQSGQAVNWHNLWSAVKKRWIYFATVFLVFIIDLGIIILYVGTNKIGYAGIDTSYGIVDFLKGILGIVRGRISLYIIATIIGVLFLVVPICISWIREQHRLLCFVPDIIIPVLSFGYFLGVQFILHAKGGMYERYLLPTTIAFACFWLVDMNGFIRLRGKYAGRYYLFIVLMAAVLFQGVNDEERARDYAEDGINTTAMLSKVAEYAEEMPNVLVGIEYEQDFSASAYLQEKCNISSTYNLSYSVREDDMVRDGYICSDGEQVTISLYDIQIFMGYPHILTPIMDEYGISQQDFDIYTYGNYVLYVRLAWN